MEDNVWKVLVVDDEPNNLQLLGQILQDQYQLSFATDGAKALDAAWKVKPDIILLDIMMPEMDGYEVCRRLKADPETSKIPVIFVTAMGEMEDEHLGFEVGGVDYITKPVSAPIVLARVHNHLELKNAQDELRKKNEELTKTKAELSRYVSLSTLKMVESKVTGHSGPLNYDTYVTVLFSDIRGFTQISEGMAPNDLFNKLNANIGKQLRVIEEYQGIIDKLSGDEVMAVFEGPEMGKNALRCALEIVHELSESENKGEIELPYVGIGINTGPIYLGSLGNESFRDYTAIGNTVNIAARLCGLADKCQILFTKTTLDSVHQGEFHFNSIGEKMLKGLSKPIEVFQMTL